MPPSAATTGSAARRGSRRSATNSRLSSSPATKKKMASSPSLAHVPRRQVQVKGLRADGGVAQSSVGVGPRRVGPHQRDGGREQQQRAPDGLAAQQLGDAEAPGQLPLENRGSLRAGGRGQRGARSRFRGSVSMTQTRLPCLRPHPRSACRRRPRVPGPAAACALFVTPPQARASQRSWSARCHHTTVAALARPTRATLRSQRGRS